MPRRRFKDPALEDLYQAATRLGPDKFLVPAHGLKKRVGYEFSPRGDSWSHAFWRGWYGIEHNGRPHYVPNSQGHAMYRAGEYCRQQQEKTL